MQYIPLIPMPFLLWALYTDWKSRKIYNYTTYSLAVAGLISRFLIDGAAVLGMLLGIAAVYMFLVINYKGLKAGGGDVKLMLACTLFVGLRHAALFVVLVFVVSALCGFIQYGRQHGFKTLGTVLKTDLMTVGTAPKEKVHVLGALVMLVAYSITQLMAGVWLNV